MLSSIYKNIVYNEIEQALCNINGITESRNNY